MPKSHRFLAQYLIVPSTLLAPATHIQTNKPTNPQRYIRLHHWHTSYVFKIAQKGGNLPPSPFIFSKPLSPNPLRKARYCIKTTLSDRSLTPFRGGKKILKDSGRNNSEKITQVLRHIYWQAIVVLIVLQPITDFRWIQAVTCTRLDIQSRRNSRSQYKFFFLKDHRPNRQKPG